MNILIIARDFKPDSGGIAEYTHQIAHHLHSAGDNVIVLAQKSDGDEVVDSTCLYKIMRYDFDNVKSSIIRRYYIIYKVIKNAAIKHSADVIICNVLWGDSEICWSVSKFLNIPYCIFTHGTEVNRKNDSKGYFIKSLITLRRKVKVLIALVWANRVFCNSFFTQNLVRDLGVPSNKTVILNPGVHPGYLNISDRHSNFHTIKKLKGNNKKVILTLSRLIERKGFDVTIRALEIVRKKIPNIVYIIAGEGPYRGSLEKLVEKLDLQANVTFSGYVTDEEKDSYYNAADIFVMPNRELDNGDVEGFGIVFLEANAFGKPVIGGISGGAVDAISNGKTGLLVDPLDVDDVALKIIQLLENEEYAKKLGMQGKDRVEKKFNWETIVSDMQIELRKILSLH